LCIHAEVDIGIFGIGSTRASGTEFENQYDRLAAVLRVMATMLTGLKPGAIASVENGIAGVGDEHDRSSQDENEFVFVSVPMALTRPSARARLQRLMPNWVRPAACPSRRLVLFRHG
jgi:hypothetical protein